MDEQTLLKTLPTPCCSDTCRAISELEAWNVIRRIWRRSAVTRKVCSPHSKAISNLARRKVETNPPSSRSMPWTSLRRGMAVLQSRDGSSSWSSELATDFAFLDTPRWSEPDTGNTMELFEALSNTQNSSQGLSNVRKCLTGTSKGWKVWPLVLRLEIRIIMQTRTAIGQVANNVHATSCAHQVIR